MRPRKLALLLAVVGLVLLPAPFYLGAAAQMNAPPAKTSQEYAAEPLDPTDDSDQGVIADRHGSRIALSVHQVSERYSAGEYRAPNVTNRTLRTAMAEGSATTDDPDARADLRAIADEYRFVYDAYGGHEEQHYRLRVSQNGSAVEATAVDIGQVANETIDRAPRYEDLTSAERATVDDVLDNSGGEYQGYRPRADAAFVDRLPTLVWKDGTLYSIHVVGHADDLGGGFIGFVVGIYVAGFGVLLVLAGGGVYAVDWWRS